MIANEVCRLSLWSNLWLKNIDYQIVSYNFAKIAITKFASVVKNHYNFMASNQRKRYNHDAHKIQTIRIAARPNVADGMVQRKRHSFY